MREKRHKLDRKGLTAIELLVATALASMMIAATMGLLRTMALQQSALKARTTFEPWYRPLAEQLRRDVANARSAELKSSARGRPSSPRAQEFDSLVLTGYCSRSPSTFLATLRPAKITYRVETMAEDTWLVRYEEQLDSSSNANVRKELVCSGVTGIAVEGCGSQEQRASRTSVLPESCRIVLLGQSGSPPLIEINVCR